jgi:ketosteroid isomerase-like protein
MADSEHRDDPAPGGDRRAVRAAERLIHHAGAALPAQGALRRREFLSTWAAGFDDFGFEADEAIEAGDSVVVCLHQWGRGRETGALVESRTWQVFNFRGGRIIRCRGYPTKAEALATVGLEA